MLSIHSGCQLPPWPTPGGPRSSSRPLPIHFQAKAWVIESVPTRFAAAWRSRKVPLKSSLPLCARGKQESLSPDSCCNRSWRAAFQEGLCPDSDQILLQYNSWNGGRKDGGAYAREHASELTREYSVTGLLQHSLKSLLLALPAFISHLHITYFLSKLVWSLLKRQCRLFGQVT